MGTSFSIRWINWNQNWLDLLHYFSLIVQAQLQRLKCCVLHRKMTIFKRNDTYEYFRKRISSVFIGSNGIQATAGLLRHTEKRKQNDSSVAEVFVCVNVCVWNKFLKHAASTFKLHSHGEILSYRPNTDVLLAFHNCYVHVRSCVRVSSVSSAHIRLVSWSSACFCIVVVIVAHSHSTGINVHKIARR